MGVMGAQGDAQNRDQRRTAHGEQFPPTTLHRSRSDRDFLAFDRALLKIRVQHGWRFSLFYEVANGSQNPTADSMAYFRLSVFRPKSSGYAAKNADVNVMGIIGGAELLCEVQSNLSQNLAGGHLCKV